MGKIYNFSFDLVFKFINASITLFTLRKKFIPYCWTSKPIAKRVNFKLKSYVLKLLSENLVGYK